MLSTATNLWVSALLPWLAISLLVTPTHAAYINFVNCLDDSIVDSSPLRLQFTPYFVDATFDADNSANNLRLSIYGNVSGQATQGTYPPPDSSTWTNSNDTFGKIVDVDPNGGNYTTLLQEYKFLNYNAYIAPASQFCAATLGDSCPLAPSFNGSRFDPRSLSAFSVEHQFDRSYLFATLRATMTIKSGDTGAPIIGCISAKVTPDLGGTINDLLTFLPAAILIFVAIATAAAAIYSPWGSSDPFKWTTNYGRDEDLLRLVTPGFADCLHYIQFIFLTGALSLSYPGYYQPITSQVSWSALLFNESFVSGGNTVSGASALQDGIYVTNGTYGMTRMRQLVGMQMDQDLWACMAIYLLVLIAVAVILCQLAFFVKWAYHKVSSTAEEDLRSKDYPMSIGMCLRIVLNYFLLPIVTLSFFQFVIASQSRVVVIVFAVVLLALVLVSAARILWVIFRTKPRALLFDDLRTVLMYGALYNTFSDERAPFALVFALLTSIRGLAIGAVQPSGIAQLVILAICEVVFLLMLHAFRPFHAKTSMNIVHTVFTAIRLAIILLMIAFVPSLGVNEGAIGWIGYLILILHGFVLLIFFANALSTMFEVVARFAGAGSDAQHGAQRGGLVAYGWRQLRKRGPGKDAERPGSMTSNAAILAIDTDSKSMQLARSRSQSASSQMMLGSPRRASGFEPVYQGNDYLDSPDGVSPHRSVSFSEQHRSPSYGSKLEQSVSDPYFRAPRGRRNTLDPYTPLSRNRLSSLGEGWGKGTDDSATSTPVRDHEHDMRSGSPHRVDRALGDTAPDAGTDYAVREMDQYYGLRGPALSDQPARKRKTGPVDPMGPVSSAATWFNKLVGGIGAGRNKTKDEGKGFEVVRNFRPPPPMRDTHAEPDEEGEAQEMETSPAMSFPRYRDTPSHTQNLGPAATAGLASYDGIWDHDIDRSGHEDDDNEHPRGIKETSPPILQPIDTSGFDVPFLQPNKSQRTRRASADASNPLSASSGPAIPRRSSRRTNSQDIKPHEIMAAVSRAENSTRATTSKSAHPPAKLSRYNLDNNRPTSLGLVSQRTTRDSIVSGRSRDAQETSAEIVHD